jgi:Domain of unknown function (DUF4294)
MKRCLLHIIKSLLLILSMAISGSAVAQHPSNPRYGPYDTLLVPAMPYEGDTISYQELPCVYVYTRMPKHVAARIKEWNRLRNAVYVTYPYAQKASVIINEINKKLEGVTDTKERKKIIKERERELRKEFTKPLTDLSIYQGKVLMKLINRKTNNTCFEIIKEYKGSFAAGVYQTVAFFFETSLKQTYDGLGADSNIEKLAQEVERMYGVM